MCPNDDIFKQSRNEHEEAIVRYDKALAINPQDVKAWHCKGNSLAALGRQEEAIVCYDMALVINPQYANAWHCKGNSLAALGRQEYARACSHNALAVVRRKGTLGGGTLIKNVRELKLTAALYASKSWIVYEVKKTGKLPKEISPETMSGAWIGLKLMIRKRGTDIELTPDEQLVFDAIVTERRLPGGNAILLEDVRYDAEGELVSAIWQIYGEDFYPDKALLTKLEDTERHNRIKLFQKSLDPMPLLDAFPSLHIKKGFVLRAYPYHTELGGVGNVWVVPASSSIPNPEECETIDLFELPRPFPINNSSLDGLTMEGPVRLLRPPDALDNIMEAIEGDGTLDSYLSASIFAREIAEYGADWHGVIWSEQTILVGNPWTYPARIHNWSDEDECGPSKNTKEWVWLDSPPSEWRPSVVSNGEVITVNFYTYSPLGQEAIYHYSDLYKIDSYKFEWDVKIIAGGPALTII